MCYGGRNTRGMGFKAMITNDFCISINRILICNTAAFDIGWVVFWCRRWFRRAAEVKSGNRIAGTFKATARLYVEPAADLPRVEAATGLHQTGGGITMRQRAGASREPQGR